MTFQGATSDKALWHSVLQGDGSAFAEIYDRHVNAVFVQCARRVGGYHDAQDLVSVVFLEAWRCGDRVRFVEGTMRPWLLVVAVHVSGKYLRSQRRYEAAVRRLPAPRPEPDIADDAAQGIDLAVAATRLAEHIGSLNSGEQDVLSLCGLGELSYAEAAAVLHIPIGTVRSRLSRAHAKLREHLVPDVVTTQVNAGTAAYVTTKEPRP